MRICAYWVWYPGAGFRGFQQQPGLRTVQGELLAAFARAGLERNPVVAGRTDRAVSARMQVLSSRVPDELSDDEVLHRLRAQLPEDLGVHRVVTTAPKFHAAWSASGKTYRYAIPAAAAGDWETLREAATLIPGTRDFSVFHFKTSAKKPRTVRAIRLQPTDGGIEAWFDGDGFARYMVRMLVGAMTAVARGQLSMATLRAGLEEQRLFHCPTAPPEPLTLWEVRYPPALDPFGAEERAAFQWAPALGG